MCVYYVCTYVCVCVCVYVVNMNFFFEEFPTPELSLSMHYFLSTSLLNLKNSPSFRPSICIFCIFSAFQIHRQTHTYTYILALLTDLYFYKETNLYYITSPKKCYQPMWLLQPKAPKYFLRLSQNFANIVHI